MKGMELGIGTWKVKAARVAANECGQRVSFRKRSRSRGTARVAASKPGGARVSNSSSSAEDSDKSRAGSRTLQPAFVLLPF